MSGQCEVSLCLPQLPAEIQNAVHVLGKKLETEGSMVGNTVIWSQKIVQQQAKGLLWELGQGAGSAAYPCGSRNVEKHRPLVLVVISVRSEGLTPP